MTSGIGTPSENGTDEQVILTMEQAKHMLDLIMGTMNYSSGFFDHEDTELIEWLADKCHVTLIGTRYQYTVMHLWHQDCVVYCGKPANDKIHRNSGYDPTGLWRVLP